MSVESKRLAARKGQATGRLRLGLYDPDPDRATVVYVGRSYPDNEDGRQAIQQSIAKFNRMSQREGIVEICLGVFEVQA